jgi:hypothetical protein
MIGCLKVQSRQLGNLSSIALAAAPFWRDLLKFDHDRAPCAGARYASCFWVILLTEYSRIRNRTHPMLASTRALNQLGIGVADGVRTHDNRNHKPGDNLALARVCGRFLEYLPIT